MQFVAEHEWVGEDVWFAHMVHLDDADLQLCAQTGTGIAHCPQSNARLGSGIAPHSRGAGAGRAGGAWRWMAPPPTRPPTCSARRTPAGCCTAPEPARGRAARRARPREPRRTARRPRQRALTVEDVVHLGTAGGARVLGLPGVGTLEVGQAADLAVYDLDRPRHFGLHDPAIGPVASRRASHPARPARAGPRGGGRPHPGLDLAELRRERRGLRPHPPEPPMSFEPSHVKTATAQVASTLSAIEWITDARIERLSQDFYWFSPVLKRQLEHLRADAVARPKTEDEIRAVVAACAAARLPITVRGSGTGNYGQSMPLHGGVVLDLSAFNRLLWARDGVARAQAGHPHDGARPQAAGRAGRRPGAGSCAACPPPTAPPRWAACSGGGFGGIGSINHGPLASTGNVLGVRAMTIEPEPKAVELRAPEALLLHHVYRHQRDRAGARGGTRPGAPWLEAIACFRRTSTRPSASPTRSPRLPAC
jgi:hypothetical protein